MQVDLFTIGYTKSTAERFFDRLTAAGVRRLADVRSSNRSQLAGFAKVPDLAFFLDRVAGIEYRHEPLLTPPLEMMRAYRDGILRWEDYEAGFRRLLAERDAAQNCDPSAFDRACLLCSEPVADRCHRRVAAEYLKENWPVAVSITHL